MIYPGLPVARFYPGQLWFFSLYGDNGDYLRYRDICEAPQKKKLNETVSEMPIYNFKRYVAEVKKIYLVQAFPIKFHLLNDE